MTTTLQQRMKTILHHSTKIYILTSVTVGAAHGVIVTRAERSERKCGEIESDQDVGLGNIEPGFGKEKFQGRVGRGGEWGDGESVVRVSFEWGGRKVDEDVRRRREGVWGKAKVEAPPKLISNVRPIPPIPLLIFSYILTSATVGATQGILATHTLRQERATLVHQRLEKEKAAEHQDQEAKFAKAEKNL
ncbi:hypothetical protein HDV00_010914 [Rhizophlyctis rosea]|nr:hypothetical protein HDV00_010914 [Rhizophlyctis rosea]